MNLWSYSLNISLKKCYILKKLIVFCAKKFSIKRQMKTVMKHTEYSNLKNEAFLINWGSGIFF